MVQVEAPGVAVGPDADAGQMLATAAVQGRLWLCGDDPTELHRAWRRALDAGLPAGDVVLAPGSASLVRGLVSRRGAGGDSGAPSTWLGPDADRVVLGLDAEREGAEPGGALEALVVLAVCAGVGRIRSTHARTVRRTADVVAALARERATAEREVG